MLSPDRTGPGYERLARGRRYVLAVFLYSTSLIGCSAYHPDLRPEHPTRAVTGLFEAFGAGQHGERELFSSDQQQMVCASVENTGTRNLNLTFSEPPGREGAGYQTISVLPGQSNLLCRSTGGVTADCQEGCQYRWRVERGVPQGPQDIAAPFFPLLKDCKYGGDDYTKGAEVCQAGRKKYCSGNNDGQWFSVLDTDGDPVDC